MVFEGAGDNYGCVHAGRPAHSVRTRTRTNLSLVLRKLSPAEVSVPEAPARFRQTIGLGE